jgi:hypothetical protein
VHATARAAMRPLRRHPATGRPLARGTGLRPVLHGGATPPRHLRVLRPYPPPRPSPRPGRHDLRRLRRPSSHPPLRRLRPRGQALRGRPLRDLLPATPHDRAARHRRRTGPSPPHHRGRGDLRDPEPLLGATLGARGGPAARSQVTAADMTLGIGHGPRTGTVPQPPSSTMAGSSESDRPSPSRPAAPQKPRASTPRSSSC